MQSKKVASYKEWSIMEESVDGTGHAIIKRYEQVVAGDEDVFALLKQCPEAVAQQLRVQLVDNTIAENGGVEQFQKNATNNRINFGANFYDFLDSDTLQAFVDRGIYLSYTF